MNVEEKLKERVTDLKDKKNEEVITILQEIGKALVTEVRFETDGKYIYPLLVEAYYNGGIFEDVYCHDEDQPQRNSQRNNQFGFYIHPGKGGIDFVLSDNEDYCLSYLIKCAYVEEFNKPSRVLKQTEIPDAFPTIDCEGRCVVDTNRIEENIADVTKFRKKNFIPLLNPRKGLKPKPKGKYMNADLAIIIGIEYFNTKLSDSLVVGQGGVGGLEKNNEKYRIKS
ncbi:MAG: hypothetical protein LBN34_06550 [Clostridiales Family XIII bacterium]|nr:hypothetical protein [Clostridiales Family XIII bacterium]